MCFIKPNNFDSSYCACQFHNKHNDKTLSCKKVVTFSVFFLRRRFVGKRKETNRNHLRFLACESQRLLFSQASLCWRDVKRLSVCDSCAVLHGLGSPLFPFFFVFNRRQHPPSKNLRNFHFFFSVICIPLPEHNHLRISHRFREALGQFVSHTLLHHLTTCLLPRKQRVVFPVGFSLLDIISSIHGDHARVCFVPFLHNITVIYVADYLVLLSLLKKPQFCV